LVVAITVTAGLVWPGKNDPNRIETVGPGEPEPPTGPGDSGGEDWPPVEPRTDPVEVAAGEIDGVPRELTAYERDSGLCVVLSGGGGGCGFDVPAQHAVGFAMDSTVTEDSTGTGTPRIEAVYGPVSRDVARISIRLASGKVVEPSPVGQDAGFAVSFYVAQAPADIPADDAINEVIVYNADGNELDRLEPACPMPDRFPLGTCRSP
jgi:hypothetical protein